MCVNYILCLKSKQVVWTCNYRFLNFKNAETSSDDVFLKNKGRNVRKRESIPTYVIFLTWENTSPIMFLRKISYNVLLENTFDGFWR